MSFWPLETDVTYKITCDLPEKEIHEKLETYLNTERKNTLLLPEPQFYYLAGKNLFHVNGSFRDRNGTTTVTGIGTITQNSDEDTEITINYIYDRVYPQIFARVLQIVAISFFMIYLYQYLFHSNHTLEGLLPFVALALLFFLPLLLNLIPQSYINQTHSEVLKGLGYW